MASYFASSTAQYDNSTGNFLSSFDNDLNASDGEADTTFELEDTLPPPNNDIEYRGQITFDGQTVPVFQSGAGTGPYIVLSPKPLAQTIFPSLISLPLSDTSPFTVCFGAGTLIATPHGATAVEDLAIGDTVLAADGRGTAVKRVGRQTMHKVFAGERMQPVRIRAGALGDGVPHTDLTVTADHGLLVDDLVINAGALVNGDSIDWVPLSELPERVTYYHVETEAHDVILANGAPAETFIDHAGRRAFDNYAEYVDLYGAERIIREMDRLRISARRLVPAAIRRRLGIADDVIEFDAPLSA